MHLHLQLAPLSFPAPTMKPKCRRQTEPEQEETECDEARNKVAHLT